MIEEKVNNSGYVEEVPLRVYIEIIIRRKWIIILSFFVMTFFTIFFTKISQIKEYIAEASILIEKSIWKNPVFKDMNQEIYSNSTSLATHEKIMQSLSVAEETIRVFRAKSLHHLKQIGKKKLWVYDSEAPEIFQKKLQVKILPATNVIKIKIKDLVSEDTMALVNTFVKVFVNMSIKLKTKEMLSAYNFVKEQMGVVKEKLKDTEEELWQYKRSTNFRTLGLGIEQLNSLESSYVDTKVDLDMANARYNYILKELKNQNKAEKILLVDISTPMIEKLREKLVTLEYSRALLLKKYTEKHPDIIEKNMEIDEAKQILKDIAIKTTKKNIVTVDAWAYLQDLMKESLRLQIEINTLTIRLNTLEALIKKYVDKLPELAENKTKVARLERILKLNQERYSSLLSKEENLRLSMAAETGKIKVLDYAVSAKEIITNKTRVNAFLGGIIGIVLGLIIALLLEHMDTSIKTIEDVKENLNLQVIGVIPSITPHKRSRFFKWFNN